MAADENAAEEAVEVDEGELIPLTDKVGVALDDDDQWGVQSTNTIWVCW